jgi:hypothetical protein
LTIYPLALIAVTFTAAPEDDSLRRKFEAEYPAASRRLREFYTNVHMTGTETRKDGVRQWEFCGNAVLMRSVVELKNGAAGVVVANPKLSFELDKASGANRFTVSAMGSAPPHEYRDLVLAIWRRTLPSSAAFTIQSESITDFISEKSFRCKDVREVDSAGSKVLRLSWENFRSKAPKVSGSLDFVADGTWALTAFEIHFPETMNTKTGKFMDVVHHGVMEYDGKEAGMPLIHKLRIWDSGPGGKTDETVFEVTELKPGAVASEEFTLGAFGISTSPAAERVPVAYYLFGLSAVLALAVVGFRYMSHRKSRGVASA